MFSVMVLDVPGNKHWGFSGWSKAKAALDKRIVETRKKVAGGDASEIKLLSWRLHDLRRTAATVMADRLGVLPHIVETILNHVSGHRAGVAGIYNRAKYEADMRKALQQWDEHVVRLVSKRCTHIGNKNRSTP